MHTYIVTVAAADQVGIVHEVTGALTDLGGNIIELSQTVQRGSFTIILHVEFESPQDSRRIKAAIAERGRRFGLHIAVMPEVEPPEQPASSGERFILTVIGDDHRGNIHGIAGCLARRGVNIVDLHAKTEHDQFRLVMEAFLPPDVSPASLRSELEAFGAKLGLEAYVQHENIFRATWEPRPVRVGSPRVEA